MVVCGYAYKGESVSSISLFNPKVRIAVTVLGFVSEIGPVLNKQLRSISVHCLNSDSSPVKQ